MFTSASNLTFLSFIPGTLSVGCRRPRRHDPWRARPKRALINQLPRVSAEEALAERAVTPHEVHHGPTPEIVLDRNKFDF